MNRPAFSMPLIRFGTRDGGLFSSLGRDLRTDAPGALERAITRKRASASAAAGSRRASSGRKCGPRCADPENTWTAACTPTAYGIIVHCAPIRRHQKAGFQEVRQQCRCSTTWGAGPANGGSKFGQDPIRRGLDAPGGMMPGRQRQPPSVRPVTTQPTLDTRSDAR